MNYKTLSILFLLMTTIGCHQASAQFSIADSDGAVSIVYNIESSALDSIAAHLLAQDIESVTGKQPAVYTDLEDVNGNVIILGDVTSDLINTHIETDRLSGQWETYERVFIDNLTAGIDQAMFIAGSDPRGMAYGVFDLSRQIGVSPWYWWADVPIKKMNTLSVSSRNTVSTAPSIKYRGIFLNDEGWGLEPWASNTFEPSVGNIGPKTYAKIFELLLRLKANTIWPAMHPNTVAFFQVPGNPETAEEWEIVVGSSHAEPMLRNNVGEWNYETSGDFNYRDNASSVYNYWEQRVEQSQGLDAIYTVGMRGVHDSGMVGYNSMDERVSALETIISDQRGLLRNYINEDVSEIPQSFTAYKEVLDIYESGMDLPEDITLIWPEDNHGYIRRFPDQAEQQRSGGSGVYYHLSYLGSPHPYIWLSPTTPALVWREMTRAWQQNMNEIWIANVGDLKRREWETEFFMDLAWDIDSWRPENIRDYFEIVASRDISEDHGPRIADMMWEYYRLATERKPEFMGFNASQWAGWPPVQDPLYSLWHYGDEAQQRIDSYRDLQTRAGEIGEEIPQEARDTYFQLVYYPIAGATAMNEKLLYAYKSRAYAKQGRAAANQMSDSAFVAYNQIKQLTHHFNHEVAGGKWERIVDDSPGYRKGSLVFWEPITTRINTDGVSGVGVAIEGQSEPLLPIDGSLPGITTRESTITMSVSEADIFGELATGTDSVGTFLEWPDDQNNRTISEPGWDTIPYEIDYPTKAVFEFNYEAEPGGVHTLNLSVDQPDQDNDSWWVTLNDKPPVRADDSFGRNQQLMVDDYVLKPGRNTLSIHSQGAGARLYGVEFIQESRHLSPGYSEVNSLPTFNRYNRQRHFIDIFSRGQETEEWSANSSAPWIQLSQEEGELSGGSERIWVTVNYDEAPAVPELSGYIDISSGEQRYRVVVPAVNHPSNLSSDAYVETNGVISIPASQYNQMQPGSAASWHPVTGLGRSGSAMLLQPMDGWYVQELSQVRQQSPVLEYEIVVTGGGPAEVIVEAIPAFPLNVAQQMRSAVSIGDGEPQWITFEMGDPDRQPWIDNVLESRMIGTTELTLDPGTYRFKIWGTDPSVNIDKIIIDFGGLKPSYVGPSPTRISSGQ